MLQEKHKDLDAAKQKQLLERMVAELSRAEPDFYYKSTSEVALQLHQRIKSGTNLSVDDRALLKHLSQRDISVILSLH